MKGSLKSINYSKVRGLNETDFFLLIDGIDVTTMEQVAIEFTCLIFNSYSLQTAIEIMLLTMDKLLCLKKKDYLSILSRLSNNEIGASNFIIFMGKYLKVDFRYWLKDFQKDRKTFIIKFIGSEESTYFYFDQRFDTEVFRRLSVDTAKLKFVENELLNEGVPAAKAKKPKEINL